MTALYEIVPASGKIDLPSVDSLKYQRTELTAGSGETMTVKFRYKAPDDTTSRLITQTLGSRLRSFDDASTNLRFAAAVAGFGMLLRGSEFKGDASYEDILRIAKGAQGEDAGGYRAEFLRLVEVASGFPH